MIDMYVCVGKNLEVSEYRLKKLYKKMISSMPSEYRPLLEKSQSAWLEFRNAQCKFINAADNEYQEIPCRLEMNEDREKSLTEEMKEDCNVCIPYGNPSN